MKNTLVNGHVREILPLEYTTHFFPKLNTKTNSYIEETAKILLAFPLHNSEDYTIKQEEQ